MHVQAVRELRGTNVCEDVWTCDRPPGGRFDRVGLHRLARCEEATGAVLLYLPGMHMNGGLPIAEPEHDLRVYLAAAGVRTWGLDYRTHAVPPDASAAELQALGAWTAELFADDAAWAVAFVRGRDPGPLYLAGFSQGAALAYRLVARAPGTHAGLLVLDGAGDTGPARTSGAPAVDVAGGRLSFDQRQRLLADVLADPARPSPLGDGTTAGAALAQILYSAPSFGGHGGLANTRDGFSDVRTLAALLRSYDRWWPRAALGQSAPRPPAGGLPVLAFASTNLGQLWIDRVRTSAEAFGGQEAIVHTLPGYGHLDVLVGRRAARDVFAPALAWLANQPPS
jgi:hypothetical protein